MSRKLVAGLALAGLAAVAPPCGSQASAGPEWAGRSVGGVSWSEARFPGAVVAVAAVPRPEGGRDLFVLAAPAGAPRGPRELWRLDRSAAGSPWRGVRLRDGLSAGLDALDAVDLDGDGRMELLAGEPRRIYCLGSPWLGGELPGCELEAPGWIDLRAPDAARLRAPAVDRRLLTTAEVGRVRFFRAGGGRLERVAEERLPVEASRKDHGLRLVSPPLARVVRAAAPPLWVAGPQAVGSSRLRLLRLDPEGPEEAARRAEAWCRLPGPERVESSALLDFDGTPCLVALTVRADKLGVFEKLRLRVFPLATDRTRAGRGPSFVAETGTSRWRGATIAARDLDGDGRVDLAILGPLGLRGEKLGVQVHAGLGGGRFQAKAASAEIGGGESEGLVVDDLTGDGRADLLVHDAVRVALHAGLATGDGPSFAARPLRSVDFAPARKGVKVEVAVGGGGVQTRSLGAHPELLAVDLDGDRHVEVIFLSEESGRGLLRVVDFD